MTQSAGQATSTSRTPEQLLAAIRREAGRNALRARNGIRLAAGQIPEPERWVTPYDVVWSRGRAQLWHYRSDQVQYRPPLLMVYSLANRSYIFDLAPGNSFIEALLAGGIDVYLVDWGVPDERDCRNTLDTYACDGIGDAIRAVRRESGQPEVNLFGYCMGGLLCLLGMAAHPEWPVRSLSTVAVPLDMRRMDIAGLGARSGIRMEELFDENGDLPGSVVEQAFNSVNPIAPVTEYATLLDGLWSEEYIAQYKLFVGWGHDHIPMAGAVAEEMLTKHIRGHSLPDEGTLELGGRKVSLADIKVPFRSIVADRDTIVPPAATEKLPDLVGSDDSEEIRLPGGHIGLIVGRSAHKRSIPKLVEFLQSMSDQITPDTTDPDENTPDV